MTLPSRLFAAAVIGALAVGPASAQFRRGILAESTEVMLFPAMPPALLLPAGKFQVDVKNQSTGPARLLSRLDDAITTQMAENDSRLQVAEGKPEIQVVATLTEWTLARRRGTRYVSETRQIGTKQVTDSKGNKKTEPVYEYGRNKPTVIDEGAAAVRRRGAARHAGAGRRDGAIHLSRRSPGRGRPALNDRSGRYDAGSRRRNAPRDW